MSHAIEYLSRSWNGRTATPDGRRRWVAEMLTPLDGEGENIALYYKKVLKDNADVHGIVSKVSDYEAVPANGLNRAYLNPQSLPPPSPSTFCWCPRFPTRNGCKYSPRPLSCWLYMLYVCPSSVWPPTR
jgi:hypothetical protein